MGESVKISVFGKLTIETQRGKITQDELKSDKITKFIVFLTLNRRAVISPDALCSALWQHSCEDPYGALRALSFRAKRALAPVFVGERLIVAKGGSYRINEALDIQVDAETLTQLIKKRSSGEPDLKGEDLFLSEHLNAFCDTVASDMWGISTATYYNSQLLELLTRHLDSLFEASAHDRIIELAVNGLKIDPLSESLHATVIRALVAKGNYVLAKNHYSSTVRLFESEFSVSPTKALTDAMKF